jgi:hypothetical protein
VHRCPCPVTGSATSSPVQQHTRNCLDADTLTRMSDRLARAAAALRESDRVHAESLTHDALAPIWRGDLDGLIGEVP